MYCFHESLPASRPPPVAFSPPKAPPISAPFVGMFTFTIPQSLPCGLQWVKTSWCMHKPIKRIHNHSRYDNDVKYSWTTAKDIDIKLCHELQWTCCIGLKEFKTTNPVHLKMISGRRVKIELLNPCGTELLISIASFKV